MGENSIIECKCVNEYKNRVFILSKCKGELLEYDSDNKKLYYIGKLNSKDEYVTSCLVGGRIVFFGANSNTICEFNIDDNTLKYFPIEVTGTSKQLKECWLCATYKDYIYVACGSGSVPLVRIDSLTYKADLMSCWNECFESKYGKQAVIVQKQGLCISDGIMWLPLNEPNVVLKYDIAHDTYDFCEVPTEKMIFHTVNCEGDTIWLTGEKKIIVKWNVARNTVEEFTDFCDGFEYNVGSASGVGAGLFYNGFIDNQSIFFLPLEGNMVIRFNKELGHIEQYSEILDDDEYCFCAGKLSGGRFYAEFNNTSRDMNRVRSCIINKNSEVQSLPIKRELVVFSCSRIAKVIGSSERDALVEDYSNMLPAFIEMVIADQV